MIFHRLPGYSGSDVFRAERGSIKYIVARPHDVSGWTAQVVTPRGDIVDVMRNAETLHKAQGACIAHAGRRR